MWFFKKKEKHNLVQVSFLQALGLVLYCSLVGLLFWKGNTVFGRVPNYLGPVLFLTLFVTSALISAVIVLGYAFRLVWEEKQTKEALMLVSYTALWLILFILILLLLITVF